jgi:hypothetical protein
VLLLALATAACDRPQPLLVCHNANCDGAIDPSRDDTLEALQRSLALRHGEQPAIDGIELDLFWHGADERCLFAHDLENQVDPATAGAAIAEVADHVRRGAASTASGAPFIVLLELKGQVGVGEEERHSPAQREHHASCALDAWAALAQAATAAAVDVRLLFSSFDPELLGALTREPRWTAALTSRVRPELVATLGLPLPLDSQTRSLADFSTALPIAVVEAHPDWLSEARFESLRGRHELALWTFSTTSETLAAVTHYRPALLVTSEALLLRRWLLYCE